jgi:hypothetical protein
MLLRDSNAVTMSVVALPALVAVVWLHRRGPSRRRRGMAIGLAAVIVAGSYSITAQLGTDRGATSFHNDVGLRWLPDARMSAFMEARGMPVTPALLERTGRDAWADGEAFLRSPELRAYREWADGRGRLAAATSFVTEADWYLGRFRDELAGFTADDQSSYDTHAVAERFPERPLGPLDPAGSPAAMVLWSLAGAAAVALAWRWRRPDAWFLLVLAAPVASDLYLVYVADAVEVSRHLVGPLLRFSVVAVVSAAVGVDVAVERFGRAPRMSEGAADATVAAARGVVASGSSTAAGDPP